MVSSKVSYPVQRFPVFLVRNPMMNLGNIPRNAALDAWFGGFPVPKHRSFLDVSCQGVRNERRTV